MENRGPGSALPPEIRADLLPEELEALERIWLQSDYGLGAIEPADSTFEDCIPMLADELRTFLCAEGMFPVAHPVRPADSVAETRVQRSARILPFRKARISPLRPWQGYAAIAACVAMLLAVGITLDNNTIEAEYGETLTHTLVDGSKLLLNSGARIRVASKFNKDSRELRIMRGEVQFDVAKSNVPFTVRTAHGRVEVLGTSFNVRYWPTDAESATDVAVESGRVRVIARPGREVILESGDTARMGRDGQVHVTEATADAENQLSWASNSFKFSDHPTGDILEELERRYDVDIQVDVEGLEKTRSGILLENPEGPEQILDDICELHQCGYSKEPDGRTFRIAPH
jgi:ferric-dicitrate binding protein FerR (iron transport regulator)